MGPSRENDDAGLNRHPEEQKGGRPTAQRQQQQQQRRRRVVSRQAIATAAAVSVLTLSFHGGARCGANAASLPTPQIIAVADSKILQTRGGGGLFGNAAAAAASGKVAKRTPGGEDDDASATLLRELKATVQSQSRTIQSQSNQIAALEKRLVSAKKKSSSSSSGGGTTPKLSASSHGAGAHGAHGGGGGSVEAEIHTYLTRPSLSLAMDRVWWLGLFLASLSLTAVIMSGFEHTLSRQIELAYFVPLLIGHGGNTGGQTVGTVLAAMSSGVITTKDAPRVVTKEAVSGWIGGMVLGLAVASVSKFVMGISSHVSTVILLTIPILSAIAAASASVLPFLCVAMGLDPTVIAAPAMTSFVDVAGLVSYFMIARGVFNMFGLEL